MNTCKACGKEIKGNYKPVMLGDFCSESCFWSFTETMVEVAQEKEEVISDNIKTHWDLIKRKVAKYSQFIISNKTLKPYMSLKSWGEFLGNNGLMVVRSDDEYSVIKKSIL